MTIADKLKRIAKLEKRQRRLNPHELTELQMARMIGLCLTCAAHGHGSEVQRDAGRRIAIMFARNRTRTGDDLSPGLSNLLLRALVGQAGVTSETCV